MAIRPRLAVGAPRYDKLAYGLASGRSRRPSPLFRPVVGGKPSASTAGHAAAHSLAVDVEVVPLLQMPMHTEGIDCHWGCEAPTGRHVFARRDKCQVRRVTAPSVRAEVSSRAGSRIVANMVQDESRFLGIREGSSAADPCLSVSLHLTSAPPSAVAMSVDFSKPRPTCVRALGSINQVIEGHPVVTTPNEQFRVPVSLPPLVVQEAPSTLTEPLALTSFDYAGHVANPNGSRSY